jgi:hypothetical protein
MTTPITEENWEEHCQTQSLSDYEKECVERCKQYYSMLSKRQRVHLDRYVGKFTEEQRETRDRWSNYTLRTTNLLYRIMYEDASRVLIRAQVQAYYYFRKERGDGD